MVRTGPNTWAREVSHDAKVEEAGRKDVLCARKIKKGPTPVRILKQDITGREY